MPNKYFIKRKKFFLKKNFKKFINKEIHYISSSKLYPIRSKCSEKINKLNIKLPYTYNKYMVEKLIKKTQVNILYTDYPTYFLKTHILRILF